MQAPKLYPNDLDDTDFRQMEELVSAAVGGVLLTFDEDRVAALVDILMPRGVTEPVITEETPGRLIAALWPDSGGVAVAPSELVGTVRSTLDDWHLLH